MKLIKEILKRGIIGGIIGVFLIQTMGLLSIVISGSTASITTDFFVRQYVAGAILGFIFGVLNLLFQIDRLGLTLATILHFIAQAIVFYPVAIYAKWIGTDAMSLLGVALQGTIMYFIVWIICYVRWKKDIIYINKKIKK